MWYVVHMLFAQKSAPNSETFACETSQVLFKAPPKYRRSQPYARGEEWARQHERDNCFLFVGIEHIKRLDGEPGDSCEVGGSFSEQPDVWLRRSELIPAKEDLSAIKLERNLDTPIGDLMSEEQKRLLRRIMEDGE